MIEHDSAADKSIVNELNFGWRTSNRVGWVAWEFWICGPRRVEVTNASWGFQKDDPSYIVGIEERDGLLVPAECKADQYDDEYDCKHKVALATVGDSIVLHAAVDCPTPTVDTENNTTSTVSDKMRADGGASSMGTVRSDNSIDETRYGGCDCTELSDLLC